jgi:hypothetical protein
MINKKTIIQALWLLIVLFSCATQYGIKQYLYKENIKMYFLPPSAWKAQNLTVNLDFNFKDDPESKTICNLSLIQKGHLPGRISAISINADSVVYPLENIKIITVESKSNKVRLTSILDNESFLMIMKSKNIYLEIIMNETIFNCMPQKDFHKIHEEFQADYYTIEGILN